MVVNTYKYKQRALINDKTKEKYKKKVSDIVSLLGFFFGMDVYHMIPQRLVSYHIDYKCEYVSKW